MTSFVAPLRSWLERVSPQRAGASGVGLLLAWMLWGHWATLALTRDICLWARLDARPEREAAVAFVTVGDEDLKKYPARDPNFLDRKVYARAIDRLTELGAKQIVVDILFDRPTPEGGDADQVLAAAIQRSARVVLARAYAADPKGGVTLLEPIEPLKRAAAGLGFVNIKADPDGVLRRVKLVGRAPVGEAHLNHVALEAVVRARGGGDPERLDEGLVLKGPQALFLASGADGSLPDFAAVPEIPRISLIELLEPGPLGHVHRTLVGGKFVVIGSTSPLLRDRHPYLRNWMTDARSLEDGAWFIAAVLENILEGAFLEPASAWQTGAVALAVLLLAVLLAVYRLTRGAAFTGGLVVIAWMVALSAYGRHVLVDAAGMSLGAGALFTCHALLRQLYGKRRLARLNQELSMEIARVRRELEQASRAGADAPSSDLPAYLDKSFVARFLPDRYTGLTHLGAGGMGVVYKGFDKESQTRIALKVLSPLVQDNPNAVKRFLIEANTLKGLDHISLVRVTDIQKEPLSYFAMELVDGTPLDEMISEGKGMDPKKALDITVKVADVLGYIHSRGLVHRDIKPSNIMVLKDGAVKLLDFGLVHDEGQTAITKTGDVLGTLKYMAPEQFAGGKCSPATDVYSLTVVLCQLLTGTVPPRLGHFHQPPQEFLATSALPRPFIDALNRAMEVDSEARPADGAELMKKLKEVRPLLDKTRAY